jgi:hypothetical protein
VCVCVPGKTNLGFCPLAGEPPVHLASVGLGPLEVRWTTTSHRWEILLLSYKYLKCLRRDGEAAATS